MLSVALRREVQIVCRDKTLPGVITLGPAERQADGRYACGWSVSYLHDEPSPIYGEDPIQCVERCLQFVGTFLEGSAVDGVSVWWQTPDDNGGIMSRLPGQGKPKRGATETGR